MRLEKLLDYRELVIEVKINRNLEELGYGG